MARGIQWRWLAVTGAVLAGWVALSFDWSHFLLTGRFVPIDQVDELHNPIAVKAWNQDGLHLADGRMVLLPGFARLPQASVALAAATERGVELGQDGRVYGLVTIHHWCGNDPVRYHIARIDLAHMLFFLREGQPQYALAEKMFSERKRSRFTKRGWDVSDYLMFRQFEELLIKPHR